MILKCVTNWNDRFPAAAVEEQQQGEVQRCGRRRTYTSLLAEKPTGGGDCRLGISPRDSWDDNDDDDEQQGILAFQRRPLMAIIVAETTTTDANPKNTVLGPPEQYYGEPTRDHLGIDDDPPARPISLAQDAKIVTLMGPPKQYYGQSGQDRYAYMMHEAVSLLHKHGFSTNITTLRHKSSLVTPKSNHHAMKQQNNKHFHRVPGILGFFLNDMTSDTKIAVFDPEHDELVAHIGFMTYTHPWLKVCCRSFLPEHAQVIDLLQLILSKRFLLIQIPHDSKAAPLQFLGQSTNSVWPKNENTDNQQEKNILVIKTTTAMAGTSPEKEKLWTLFVLELDGVEVAKGLWSYASEDTVGPAMELIETTQSGSDPVFVSRLLAHMEEAMIQVFSPIVAFQLRFCRVDDHPSASKWLRERGYTKGKHDESYLCKAFVVF
jgi:hypothetical protein